MEEPKFVTLNNGAKMPLVGLGTFLSKPGEVKEAVKIALRVGYRHIDCAAAYENQKEVGEALTESFAAGVVKREEVFITSKLRPWEADPATIWDKFNETLKDLQLEYVDLWLIHQPIPLIKGEDGKIVGRRGVSVQQIWTVFEDIHKSGKAKAIGVSNFPTAMLNDVLNYAKVVPAVNQIERTPYLSHQQHIAFCRANNVHITAYGPLGAPGLMGQRKPTAAPLLENTVVASIAKKHNKTVAQVLLRWQLQDNVVVIPKSIKEERIKENFDLWGWKLDEDDMKAINGLNVNYRYFDQDWHGVPTFT